MAAGCGLNQLSEAVRHFSLPSRNTVSYTHLLVQRVQRPLHIDIRITAGKSLLGTLFGFACAFHINFGRAFRGLREDGYSIRQHFRKTPCYGETLLFSSGAERDLSLIHI